VAVSAVSGLRRSVDLIAPHGVLAVAAGLEVVLEIARTKSGSSIWLVLAAVVALAALISVWHRQDELRLVPLVVIGLSFHLAWIWAHHTLGAMGDQDVTSVYPVEGNELVHGIYPESEYPVGAVLLFGLEAWLGDVQTANRLLMVVFQLACVLAIWGLRTRYSGWLAAVVAIWPMNGYYWEYRFDLVPAALIVVGLLLAYRARWGWAGLALAVGACVKWSPGLAFAVLAVWLVASARWRDVQRLVGWFAATAIALNLPFYLWAPHHFLAAYRNQGSRAITNESLWYFPLRLFGLTGEDSRVFWLAGAPHWADQLVVVLQVVLLGGLIGLAALARGRIRPALALAATAPVVFFLSNRVFSPQFLVVLMAAWLFAAALVATSRKEQLLVGLLAMGATFANAFVYPFHLPDYDTPWQPYSAAMFVCALAVTGVIVRRAYGLVIATAPPAEVVDTELLGEDLREARRSLARLRARPPVTSLPPWIGRIAKWHVAVLVAVFLVPTLFVASVLPYRFWDSLAYGEWSRVLAETGSLHAGAIEIHLQRPLFYVTQGLAWGAFGYHEWIGRLLSVTFGMAFVGCIWLLAGRLGGSRDERTLLQGFATAAVLASSVLATFVAAGMADLPVAAAATATAVLLLSPGLGRFYVPLVALAAAATLLAKTTGLLALLGLGAATLLLLRGRRRIEGLAGLAAGTGLGLVYGAFQADYLGLSLWSFLRSGNEDYWTARGAAARWDATLRAEWLGAGVRLVVVFGLVYAVARVVGARTRLALAIAGPVALLASIVGPVLADGGIPYPFDRLGLGGVGYLLLAGSLLAAPLVDASDPFGRRVYAALLLWIAPGALAWFAYRADEVRFLSPAWPGFALLAAGALTVVALALVRISPLAAFAPIAGMAVLAIANVTSIDGLGRDGWRGLLDLGPSGWTSKARVENYAYGTFSYELDFARVNVGPGQRIATNDGRLSYFFPDRVDISYPTTCSNLSGYRYFALLIGGESADFAELAGSPTSALGWLQCQRPRLTMVGQQEGIFASYVIGQPTREPTPSDCRLSSYVGGDLYDAVFADGVDYATARSIVERASSVGFQHLKVEHTNCSTFRVVISGLPPTPAGQADFREEAERSGFRVSFVPPVRYTEVPADVPPVR